MKFFSNAAKTISDMNVGAPGAQTTLKDAASETNSYGLSLMWKIALGLFSAGAGAYAVKAISAANTARKHAVKAARGLDELKTLSSSSLTSVLKKFTFPARVYIDEALTSDDATAPIIKAAGTMYASMMMAVINLENLVTSTSSVSDRLSSIATTESFEDVGIALALENLADDSDDATGPLGEGLGVYRYTPVGEKIKQLQEENIKLRNAARNKGDGKKVKTLTGTDVTLGSPDVWPTGGMYSVTLTNPTNPEASQVVPVMVQLRPFVLSTTALEAVVEYATPVPFRYKLLEVKAGEKRFVKDLLFSCDRMERLIKARQDDKDGGFAQYMKDVGKKDRFKLRSILMADEKHAVSKNIANTILVISNETLDTIKATTNVDLDKKESRDKFMRESYTMLMFVVSQTYNQVRLYMNGIDDVGVYPIEAFSSSKGGGNTDMTKLLSFIAQGRAPRSF